MMTDNFRLNYEFKKYIAQNIHHYNYNLAPVRHNHLEEKVKKIKMSKIQNSVIDAVEPLMRKKLLDQREMEKLDTRELVIQAVYDTQKSFQKQMSGLHKKEFCINMIKQIVELTDQEEESVATLIDLVVLVAKNQDLHKVFKPVSKFCLKCFYCCGEKKDKK